MLDIKMDSSENLLLIGQFDAAQVDKANEVFSTIDATRTVDFAELEYISSAGLGILLKTQKRLSKNGHELLLKNMNKHIREIFKFAGFDTVFKIE